MNFTTSELKRGPRNYESSNWAEALPISSGPIFTNDLVVEWGGDDWTPEEEETHQQTHGRMWLMTHASQRHHCTRMRTLCFPVPTCLSAAVSPCLSYGCYLISTYLAGPLVLVRCLSAVSFSLPSKVYLSEQDGEHLRMCVQLQVSSMCFTNLPLAEMKSKDERLSISSDRMAFKQQLAF